MIENIKANIKSRKIVLIIVAILIAVVIAIGITYAYYKAVIGNSGLTDVEVEANTVDRFVFESGDPITLNASIDNFSTSGDHLIGETTSTAKLLANNKTNTATRTYNVYLDILDNTFVYTSGTTPEFILTITDPNGNEVTELDGFTYVSTTDVAGFDITTATGNILVAENYEITSNDSVYYTEQTWTFKITFLALSSDQSKNENKKFIAESMIQKEEYVEKDVIAIYSEDDYSLKFYNTRETINVGDVYNNLTVTELYTGFETRRYTKATSIPWYDHRLEILSVEVVDKISPKYTNYWFYWFEKTTNVDVTNLDMSKVTEMESMFHGVAAVASSLTIEGLDDFDTSNVTTMFAAFEYVGERATTLDIGDLSKWDTSNVEDMSYMFLCSGYYSPSFDIGNLKNWNTSNVETMEAMFNFSGFESTSWYIGDISNWNTSKVENMSNMFAYAGGYADYSLNLSNWKVPLVTSYADFNAGATSKVIAPTWVN